jgi:hypothetical protein
LKATATTLDSLLSKRKEATMEKNIETTDYEAPRIEDHGDLADLTAAGHPAGTFDGNYLQGQPIPPGGAGTSGP